MCVCIICSHDAAHARELGHTWVKNCSSCVVGVIKQKTTAFFWRKLPFVCVAVFFFAPGFLCNLFLSLLCWLSGINTGTPADIGQSCQLLSEWRGFVVDGAGNTTTGHLRQQHKLSLLQNWQFFHFWDKGTKELVKKKKKTGTVKCILQKAVQNKHTSNKTCLCLHRQTTNNNNNRHKTTSLWFCLLFLSCWFTRAQADWLS